MLQGVVFEIDGIGQVFLHLGVGGRVKVVKFRSAHNTPLVGGSGELRKLG